MGVVDAWPPGQVETPMEHHLPPLASLTLAREDRSRWTVWLGRHPLERISRGPKGWLNPVGNRMWSARAKASLIGSSLTQDPNTKVWPSDPLTLLDGAQM